ncbi:MAG: phosphatase [Actinobacteria bacterium HGW-Actinobacteria-1]|jgi:putative hydrolase|nr:MAG: phosphatase [Actinobacteria bacterium HGW-Actinobacteria-1]
MRLLADLHTHTVASGHGYSTVTEVAAAAAAKGLELIAITDHGPAVPGGAHLWYFWNMKVIPSVLGGVRILKGCEANPCLDTENGIDLPDEMLSMLDFVAVGLHPACGFDEVDRVKNTEALLRVVENPLVDMITHPGNEDEFPVDLDAIVSAAVRNDVILELNNYSFDPRSGRHSSFEREREFAEAARDAGATIAVNSDAHFHLLVGEVSNALAVAEEIGFPEERIVNRDAASVLAFLGAKRERPRIDAGGVW